jgi:hypothetical protein
LELEPIPPSSLRVEVSLLQGTPIEGYPLSDTVLVDLVMLGSHGELGQASMFPEMASRLGSALSHYAKVAQQGG